VVGNKRSGEKENATVMGWGGGGAVGGETGGREEDEIEIVRRKDISKNKRCHCNVLH
jgi:hypothetical protein